mmetsp:Transcript_104161/g.334134  ORF Transcript_104161/g.334134 Transcript_104161/m.334134 type:complete len:279 (-) Transcript_104161:208-1044(-)
MGLPQGLQCDLDGAAVVARGEADEDRVDGAHALRNGPLEGIQEVAHVGFELPCVKLNHCPTSQQRHGSTNAIWGEPEDHDGVGVDHLHTLGRRPEALDGAAVGGDAEAATVPGEPQGLRGERVHGQHRLPCRKVEDHNGELPVEVPRKTFPVLLVHGHDHLSVAPDRPDAQLVGKLLVVVDLAIVCRDDARPFVDKGLFDHLAGHVQQVVADGDVPHPHAACAVGPPRPHELVYGGEVLAVPRQCRGQKRARRYACPSGGSCSCQKQHCRCQSRRTTW